MKGFRKLKSSIAVLIVAAMLVLAAPAALAASASQIDEVRGLLEQYHLSKPDDAALADKEIEEMVESLEDPYTEYYDSNEWQAYNAELEQKFVGVGIVMREDKTGIYVEDVLSGGPAEAAGVQPGDLLVSADGTSFKGKTMEEVQETIRGEEGTIVSLRVSRDGKPLSFKIARKSIQIPVVTTRMLENGIGYAALSSFTSASGGEFKRELGKLEKNKLSALIFDLRDNGGGYIDAAREVAELFIEKGVLTHMRNRDGANENIELNGASKPYPVYILVNGNSASASELLSAAMRDYGVAELVGSKTYGKGVVQSLLPVTGGGMLKVTVQEYYTPAGKKVEKVGLTPNVAVNGAAQQFISAFRLAGGKSLSVEAAGGIVTVNGVRMAQPGAVRQEKGVWQVEMKLAAELVGAKLAFKAGEYSLALGNTVRKIKTSDAQLTVKDGSSYVDVKWLNKQFAGFSYSASAEALKLKVQ
ncbi:S41 family peptidase [Paenibacillaceae bacterium WGS1546]|uniref:S41 family peptidase n=1 Tax=Cohnella sp. WGS1546 TaxID=3366810 RepID=UPI00372D50E2